MSKITTHVLDTTLGKPAAGIAVNLERRGHDIWFTVASGETDADGRCGNLPEDAPSGRYRLTFAISEYFERNARTTLYPEVSITFICDGQEHYHLPLLLSDNSYTTYRGS